MSQQHLIDNDEFCNRERTEQDTIDRMRDIADNPDCVDVDDLRDFLGYLGHFEKPLRQVKELWGTINLDTVKAANQLRTYAKHKILAMDFRAGGKIEDAMIREASCKAVYNTLPEAFRW